MNSPLDISRERVHEIYRGKAAATITQMMVENSELRATVEALTNMVNELTRQVSELSPANGQRGAFAQDNTDGE